VFDVGCILNRYCDRIHCDGSADRVDHRQVFRDIRCRLRIEQNRDPLDAGRDLLEQFEQLATHSWLGAGKPRHIAAWLRQALDESLSDRIGDQNEYDWYGVGFGLHYRRDGRAFSNDGVGSQAHDLCGIGSQAVEVARDKTIVDMDVAAVRPAETEKALLECHDPTLCFSIAFGVAQ